MNLNQDRFKKHTEYEWTAVEEKVQRQGEYDVNAQCADFHEGKVVREEKFVRVGRRARIVDLRDDVVT